MAWKPDYITAAELKAFVRVTDALDDALIPHAIAASSRAIDRHTNRQFGLVAAPELRRYKARWNRRRCRWVIEIDDLMTAAGLVVATATGTITEYDLEPSNAAAEGKPWTRLAIRSANTVTIKGEDSEMQCTGQWGWSAFPGAVREAALLQGSRLAARRDSPFGIAGSPQQGSELRLLARVDPDVAVSLTDYVRPRRVG